MQRLRAGTFPQARHREPASRIAPPSMRHALLGCGQQASRRCASGATAAACPPIRYAVLLDKLPSPLCLVCMMLLRCPTEPLALRRRRTGSLTAAETCGHVCCSLAACKSAAIPLDALVLPACCHVELPLLFQSLKSLISSLLLCLLLPCAAASRLGCGCACIPAPVPARPASQSVAAWTCLSQTACFKVAVARKALPQLLG